MTSKVSNITGAFSYDNTPYAKEIDETTKQCNVGVGTDTDFYKLIGFKELEVEQSYNGNWYLKGYAPQKPVEEEFEELKQRKKEQLKESRDDYLKLKNYNLSENDKFNMTNLLNGYTEEDRNKYIEFLKNDLIPKYNNFNNQINKANIENIEELKELEFDFIENNFIKDILIE